MSKGMSRRTFLEGAVAGTASLGLMASLSRPAGAEPPAPPPKVRIGKLYYGQPQPHWPMAAVDVKAEWQRVEKEVARIQPALADVEMVDCGVISNAEELEQAKPKLQGLDGLLILQLTMGLGRVINPILDLNLPTVLFAEPFCGHEWCRIAGLVRQGKAIDCWASSRFDDLVPALRPLKAIGRLKNAKILYVSQADPDPKYVQAIREKFGTQIKGLKLKDLEEAYQAVDDAAAAAEADGWVRSAEKIVEPSKEDILKASRMSLALQNMVRADGAAAITINCLGMGLLDRNMGYPCLGFCKLNSIGLGGICEADLRSTMTHLIFTYLVGRPGFVSDPCFDYSNNTILHAHCVSATKMLGPEGPSHPYIIRSHLEDNKGAVLQVRLPVGQPVSMAWLVGNDLMLFSTGEAVDSPLVDRGCRTKVTMRVEHPEKFLDNWFFGLHRVIVYGDHTRDIERFCRLMKIRLVREGTDEVRKLPELS